MTENSTNQVPSGKENREKWLLPSYLDVLKINAMFGILERDKRGGE